MKTPEAVTVAELLPVLRALPGFVPIAIAGDNDGRSYRSLTETSIGLILADGVSPLTVEDVPADGNLCLFLWPGRELQP